MKYLREIFDDWLTRAAGIVFVLIVALVIFNIYSDLPEAYPLFGVFNFSMVPVLFVVGGVIFVLAILKSQMGAQVGEWHRRATEKLMFLLFAGAIGIGLLVAGGYQLVDFSDSTSFCGRLCHEVMYPEYTTYQASPHSRVRCAECHVGSGADYLVKSKVSGIPLVFNTITGTYHRPITTPVENLRPARETCEQCHRPEKFSGDLVRIHTTFASDEANTRRTDTRVLRVGGGDSRVARDIHWHIAASVWYLPLDEGRQQIGWVGVENNNGKLTEYIDPQKVAEITPKRIEDEKRLMDCMDCHNRATHIFRSPNELIDSALSLNEIDSSLPYIKREGLKALDPPNASLAQAVAKVEAIKDFYRTSYPDTYQRKTVAIDSSIEKLKDIARLTTFPAMKVDWKTYRNNAGHQDSPGCLRCHGKLVAESEGQQGKAIDADCTSCHYFELVIK
ncbi:MAG: NapC/NirT family cytochrome c [Chloroflexi bacterium]|nr:NapC/NirT family cytochrome c [Chloroflexota bacterium]